MRLCLIFSLSVFFLPCIVAQSSFQVYTGLAIAKLAGEDETGLPGLLLINPAEENSTGWLMGVGYIRQLTATSNLGIELFTFALRTDVRVSRVQQPPESLQFREITLSPFYEHALVGNKIFISIGPQFSYLTGHREFYRDSGGNTFTSNFSSRNNFAAGLNGGLRYRFGPVWTGVKLSLPLGYLNERMYADYLTPYTSLALKLGYTFER